MKNKKQSAPAHHPVLKTFTRFFAVIFLIVFIVSYIATMVTVTLNSTLLRKSFVERELTNQEVYESLTDHADSVYANKSEFRLPLTHQQRVNALRAVLPFSEYQTLVTTATNEFYPLLYGEKSSPSFSYDLSGFQARLADEYVTLMPQLPACHEGSDSEFLCQPKDFKASDLATAESRNKIEKQIQNVIPEHVDLTTLNIPQGILQDKILTMQEYYDLFHLGLIGIGLLTLVLLALATLSFWLPWRRLLEVPGIALAFISGVLTALALVAHFFMGKIQLGESNDVSQIAYTTAQPLLRAVVDRFALINGIFFLIGIVLIVLAVVLSHHSELKKK